MLELRLGEQQTRKRLKEGCFRRKREQEQRREENWTWFVRETISGMIKGSKNAKPRKEIIFPNTQGSNVIILLGDQNHA